MGSLRIFPLLLASFFLLLFSSHGFGGEVMGSMEHADSIKESVRKSMIKGDPRPNCPTMFHPTKISDASPPPRKMIEVEDYHDPRPNRPTMFHPTKISDASPPSPRKTIEVEDYHDPRPNRPTIFHPTKISDASPHSPRKTIEVEDYHDPRPNRPTMLHPTKIPNIGPPPQV
ncbi:extensin-like isoform X1 [Momordica charantia]|uniref:Extensin-like isoform X1 n=1 Tax=Momordica charantia TaxID=3673 RepID=A0A6J1BWU2_MOMCH|nr:extensin-like isoform X1 [Momordica charantia]